MKKLHLFIVSLFLLVGLGFQSKAQNLNPISPIVPVNSGFIFVNGSGTGNFDIVYANSAGTTFIKRGNITTLINEAQSNNVDLTGGHQLHSLQEQGSNFIYYNQGALWAVSTNSGTNWQKLNQEGFTNVTYEKYVSPVGGLNGMYWAAKGRDIYYSSDGINFMKSVSAGFEIKEVFAFSRKIMIQAAIGGKVFMLNGNSFSELTGISPMPTYVHPGSNFKLFDKQGNAVLIKTWGNNPDLKRIKMDALDKFVAYLSSQGFRLEEYHSDVIVYNNALYVFFAKDKLILNQRYAGIYKVALAGASDNNRVYQFDALTEVVNEFSLGVGITNPYFQIVNNKLYLNYLGWQRAGNQHMHRLEHYVLNGNKFDQREWGKNAQIQESPTLQVSPQKQIKQPVRVGKPVLKKN